MISPTGQGIRGFDGHGTGRYGAPRGKRRHRGIDFEGEPGQDIVCPIDNALVVRECRPYANSKYSGMILRHDDYTLKIFYFLPHDGLYGKFVSQGDVLGTMQDLRDRYPGITPHVHLGIIDINPDLFLRLP